MSSFPSNSPFYDGVWSEPLSAFDELRERAAASPERVIDKPSREHEIIGVERHVLEDWVTELRDAHEGKRTAGLGMVVQIADEIDGYLDR